MATRATNTYAEWLERTLNDVVQAMTLPDANMEFLADFQGQIVDQLRAPEFRAAQAGLTSVRPNPMQSMQSMQPQARPPMGGLQPAAPAPPMDELRRILAQ
jgi:hypothetical protein